MDEGRLVTGYSYQPLSCHPKDMITLTIEKKVVDELNLSQLNKPCNNILGKNLNLDLKPNLHKS